MIRKFCGTSSSRKSAGFRKTLWRALANGFIEERESQPGFAFLQNDIWQKGFCLTVMRTFTFCRLLILSTLFRPRPASQKTTHWRQTGFLEKLWPWLVFIDVLDLQDRGLNTKLHSWPHPAAFLAVSRVHEWTSCSHPEIKNTWEFGSWPC